MADQSIWKNLPPEERARRQAAMEVVRERKRETDRLSKQRQRARLRGEEIPPPPKPAQGGDGGWGGLTPEQRDKRIKLMLAERKRLKALRAQQGLDPRANGSATAAKSVNTPDPNKSTKPHGRMIRKTEQDGFVDPRTLPVPLPMLDPETVFPHMRDATGHHAAEPDVDVLAKLIVAVYRNL